MQKIVILSLIVLVCSACFKNNDNQQTKTLDKNTLFVDIGAEIPDLDPQLIQDMTSTRVANDLFEGLVTFDQANKVIPGLAESWNVIKDGKTYTFYLRKGIKFSDGTKITAPDVVYSWQRLVNPKTGSPYTLIASSILNASQIVAHKLPPSALDVKALNDGVLHVNLAYPDADFISKISRPSFSIIPKHIVTKYGREWVKPKYIVTSGGYVLKEHVVNGYILVSKNPNYYDEKNLKIQNVKFYPLIDPHSIISKYKTGELDVTWTIPINQFKTLQKRYNSQLHIVPIDAIAYYNINMLKPEFKDIRVRKALSLAIDRNLLDKNVLGSGVIPLYSIISPTIDHGKYAKINYSWKNYSQERRNKLARKLYNEAGYGNDHDLKLTITYFNNDEQKKVALAIASMWKNTLGINVLVENQDWKSFLQTRKRGAYDISFGRWYADYDGVSTFTPIFECNSVVNYTKYCNSYYDNLISEAVKSNDSNVAIDRYHKALTLALNDYSIIPLYQLVSTRLTKPYIMGYPKTNNLDMIKSEWLSIR
ncbi:MAG: ABC transporter substrate-binding protein [Neisseriaceae bacterium]